MGAICGPIAYLILVGDLAHLQHLWEDPAWAMPAVVQWKAVAELFKEGIALPTGALEASFWGVVLGIVLSVSERIFPAKLSKRLPSPAAVGMAFVIPAFYSISMALGAIIYWLSTYFYSFMERSFL